MAEDALFCVGQKALIVKDKEILVLIDPQFGIDLPGGKIQVGEKDLLASLQREIQEETALKVKLSNPFDIGYFEFPTNMEHRNAGKKIYLVFFQAEYLSGEVRLSSEHTDYQWINKANYQKLLNQYQKDSVSQVIQNYFTQQKSKLTVAI